MSQKTNFDSFVQDKRLTVDGKNWLISALDPFHDTALKLTGYPDSCSNRSFVQRIVKSFTIAAPAGAAGNWDALIWNSPIVSNSAIVTENLAITHGSVTYDHAVPVRDTAYGWLNYATSDGAVNLWPNTAAFAGTNSAHYGAAALPTGYDCSRVIAAGFEVIDTTASLYKQGVVTCGSTHAGQTDGTLRFLDSNGAPWDDVTAASMRFLGPPRNAGEATVVPGSRSWPAADGAYVPARISSFHNPGQKLRSATIEAAVDTDVQVATPTAADQMQYYGYLSNTDCGYAYFQGLNVNTTLSVRFVVHVEVFPDYASSLMASVTPSATYDPVAFELYSAIVARMDLPCPQTDNPSGEFWSRILSVLRQVSQAAGPALSVYHPLAGAAVSGVGTFASLAKSAVDRYVSSRSVTIPGVNNAHVTTRSKPRSKKKKN